MRAYDNARERAALVYLLTRDRSMKWASLREQLVVGEMRPSDLVDSETALQHGAEMLEQWMSQAVNARFYTYLDGGYPASLRSVWDFPPFVFIKGDEAPLRGTGGDPGVCIVGSRKPATGSLDAAQYIARGLITEGITIVSGLAEGIDQAAHRAALEMNARTVGIIGTGIDRYYPASSKPLQQQMEDGAGMVISQFMPGASPAQFSFPMRNATMSAYGTATIIIEAAEKSGTRHQARQAVRHGRPLILSTQVANRTSWGRSLSEDTLADVKVADSPRHAVELAFGLFERAVNPELLTSVA